MPVPVFPSLGAVALDALGAPALLLALRGDDVLLARANEGFVEACGRPGQALEGRPLHAALDPDAAAALASAAVAAVEAREGAEVELILAPAGREPRRFRGHARAFGDADAVEDAWVTVSLVDVTAVRAELEQLRRRARDLEALVENSPDIVARIDRDFRHVFVNRAIEAATGQPRERFLGKDHYELGMPAELVEPWRAVYRRVFDTGQEGRKEFEFETPQGTRTYSSRVVPEFGPDGRVETVLSVARDVTVQRQAMAERLEMERRLLESQRLESLGVLAGGVAHDFNNLLAGVVGTASHARQLVESDSALDALLARIEATGLRAADLCRQLLSYAGRGTLDSGLVDLAALASETLDLLRSNIPSRIALELAAPPPPATLPMVRGDATQLRQVLMNLVLNAAEAIGDRPGLITVSLVRGQPDQRALAGAVVAPERLDGAFLVLQVTDDGCGMTPQTVRRIFDPFFTTKLNGRGLGLAATLGVVRAHGGALLVRSAPGEGTTFTLQLPATQTVAAPVVPRRAEAWQGEGLVLIVDDEDVVRRAAALIARGAGLRTLFAVDGPGAIRLLAEHPDLIDVVLLDMTMPGGDGPEVLRQLRTIRPDLPAVVTSGFSEHTVLQRMGGQAISAFVPKPFTKETLLAGLRRAFGAPVRSPFLESSSV